MKKIASLLILIIFSSALVIHPKLTTHLKNIFKLPTLAQGINYLLPSGNPNGNFETGTFVGWNEGNQPPSSLTIQSAVVHSGSYAVKLDGSDGIYQRWINLNAGDYKLIGWMRIDSTTGGSWGGVRAGINNDDWQTVASTGSLTASIVPTGQWFKIAIKFNLGQADRVQVNIGDEGDRNHVAYFDDFELISDSTGNVLPAISSFSVDKTSAAVGEDFVFSAGADDSNGAISLYIFEFGDRGYESIRYHTVSKQTTHKYVARGDYQVRLSVVDDEHARTSQTLSVTVTDDISPTVNIDNLPPDPFGNSTIDLNVTASVGVNSVVWVNERNGQAGKLTSAPWIISDINLVPGKNKITVTAQDINNLVATDNITVNYLPVGGLVPQLIGFSTNSTQVSKFDKFEADFKIINSTATNFFWPYETSTPNSEVLPERVGISVEGLFLPPGTSDWNQALIQPGFYFQGFDTSTSYSSTKDWFYPNENILSNPHFKIRFAPQQEGVWRYKVRIIDDSGTHYYPITGDLNFNVTSARPENHGFVKKSADPRYFEYSDATPFLGLGHGDGFSRANPIREVDNRLQDRAANNIDFLRIWMIGDSIYMAPWTAWSSHSLPYEGGYFTAAGLTYRESYDNHLVSRRLWNFSDPEVSNRKDLCIMQGFGDNVPLKPNKTYLIRAKVKTKNVTGPQDPSYPYGLTIRAAGWLGESGCEDPAVLSGTTRITDHVYGNTDWHDVIGTYTTKSNEYFIRGNLTYDANLYVILENTTGGEVFINDVSFREMDVDGRATGPEILRKSRFDYQNYFDQKPSFAWDYAFDKAASLGITIRPVILEKNDWITNHIDNQGDRVGNYYELNNNWFYGGWSQSATPNRRLHEYWWRYLIARWGYSTGLHSFELLNEGDPYNGIHYTQTKWFARYVHEHDPQGHMVTTSFWGGFPKNEFYCNPTYAEVDYHDFHYGTQNDTQKNDSALYREAVADRGALITGCGKPMTWGESYPGGYDNNLLNNDNQGDFLHDFLWSRLSSASLYDLNFQLTYIYQNDVNLGYHYRNLGNFLEGIPLNSGYYQDAQAVVDNTNLRAWGQKDIVNKGLHLWIQNKAHTWKNVVDGVYIAPESGTITVSGFSAGDNLTVEWWDTWQGTITSTETKTVDPSGNLIFTISDLTSDTALRILPPNIIQLKGDVNHSGTVDIQDTIMVLTNYLVNPQNLIGSYWDPIGDNIINLLDFGWVVRDWGR